MILTHVFTYTQEAARQCGVTAGNGLQPEALHDFFSKVFVLQDARSGLQRE